MPPRQRFRFGQENFWGRRFGARLGIGGFNMVKDLAAVPELHLVAQLFIVRQLAVGSEIAAEGELGRAVGIERQHGVGRLGRSLSSTAWSCGRGSSESVSTSASTQAVSFSVFFMRFPLFYENMLQRRRRRPYARTVWIQKHFNIKRGGGQHKILGEKESPPGSLTSRPEGAKGTRGDNPSGASAPAPLTQGSQGDVRIYRTEIVMAKVWVSPAGRATMPFFSVRSPLWRWSSSRPSHGSMQT